MQTMVSLLVVVLSASAQGPAPEPFDADVELAPKAGAVLEAVADRAADQVGQLAHEDEQGRWILSWGPASADNHSWFEYYPLATTFTAPFPCRLAAYRFVWSGYPAMYSAEGQEQEPFLEAMLFADWGQAGGCRPAGAPRFSKIFAMRLDYDEWVEVDVSEWGVVFGEGEVFHPGWSTNTELSTGLSYAVVPGSFSCWYSSDSPQGPVWLDAQNDWTHVFEVVVERLD